MALKPWYKVITPREDLREGRPLDASEFAVHLDQVRDGRAASVYQDPREFFERTYLTATLTGLASEVARRLNGIKTETSAVFNLTTQFGGGKTHALTLLYHLAENGPAAREWRGVQKILDKAGVTDIPCAATAVFVGTEFDSITGRGGDDGTPKRYTPWGEIAYQLGGEEALALVAEHERQRVAPAGDVIRRILPKDRPCLILLDELMNYISRNRRSGLGGHLYDFLQNLSETARGEDNVVLAVSIPASELEMTAEDQGDYDRFKKLLDRVGKAVFMSAETETSEIIRRRLFEWGGPPPEARSTISEYVDWIREHRQQVPDWFPADQAREAFEATYPFHPTVLSVFERKWQSLPRFQRTRGVLRLLALWVSRAYQEGYQGAHKDPLIGLGTAPLDDPVFRAAVFEQLGEQGLEAAVTTDICGRADSHATRLDKEAVETIRKMRLHRKVATTIFFESNGGMTQANAVATLPEMRLDAAEPDLDIGNVETVLEALTGACYYLMVENNRYRFTTKPGLNKIFSDRVAGIQRSNLNDRVRQEIQDVFRKGSGVERVFFPERSADIPDRPALTLAVLAPDQVGADLEQTRRIVDPLTREHGTSARTFKSGLIWCIPVAGDAIRGEARKVLAWQDIEYERDQLQLDAGQLKQLTDSLARAKRDLRESVWQAYKYLMLLGQDNTIRTIDLGLVHSSAADSMVSLILKHLQGLGESIEKAAATFLTRNWPPAFQEWSTKSVRDAFFASPQFPRLLDPQSIKDTIARGVEGGIIGYVGKADEGYEPFYFDGQGGYLSAADVEISDEMFIVTKETASEYIRLKEQERQFQTDGRTDDGQETGPNGHTEDHGETSSDLTADGQAMDVGHPQPNGATRLEWTGEIPYQKWMTFYTKVLAAAVGTGGLTLRLNVEIAPEGGVSQQRVEDMKRALRELSLPEDVRLS